MTALNTTKIAIALQLREAKKGVDHSFARATADQKETVSTVSSSNESECQ